MEQNRRHSALTGKDLDEHVDQEADVEVEPQQHADDPPYHEEHAGARFLGGGFWPVGDQEPVVDDEQLEQR